VREGSEGRASEQERLHQCQDRSHTPVESADWKTLKRLVASAAVIDDDLRSRWENMGYVYRVGERNGTPNINVGADQICPETMELFLKTHLCGVLRLPEVDSSGTVSSDNYYHNTGDSHTEELTLGGNRDGKKGREKEERDKRDHREKKDHRETRDVYSVERDGGNYKSNPDDAAKKSMDPEANTIEDSDAENSEDAESLTEDSDSDDSHLPTDATTHKPQVPAKAATYTHTLAEPASGSFFASDLRTPLGGDLDNLGEVYLLCMLNRNVENVIKGMDELRNQDRNLRIQLQKEKQYLSEVIEGEVRSQAATFKVEDESSPKIKVEDESSKTEQIPCAVNVTNLNVTNPPVSNSIQCAPPLDLPSLHPSALHARYLAKLSCSTLPNLSLRSFAKAARESGLSCGPIRLVFYGTK
jgi:hypothetical protein